MMWKKRDANNLQIRDIAEHYGVDLLSASILARRKIKTANDILYYLEDDSRFMNNPFLFDAMEDAVDRILLAVDEEEKVLVFGDRDADGVTSTTLLVETLSSLGLDVSWRLPENDEKYGLSEEAIDDCNEKSITLIITVDCGISNHKEVLYAEDKGIDVIIVDHHVLQSEYPPDAFAIINPKLEDCGYPFRELSGCGVAYKLFWALRFAQTELYKQDIALLNVRPLNDAYMIEAVYLSNLVEKDRLNEVVIPGKISIDKLRMVPFLQNKQIFVWDGEIQKRLLEKALGRGAEVNFYDVRMDVARIIPQAAGASLLRLMEMSKVGKYMEGELSEIDTFVSLFTSFSLRSAKITGDDSDNKLQLAAISTLADLMSLTGENRIIVRQGLQAMNKKPRRGFAELIARQNLIGKKITSTDAIWQITPVLNAAGRLGKPSVAAKMLLAKDSQESGKFADQLLELNQQRKTLGAEAWESQYEKAKEFIENNGGKYVLVCGSNIHRGITGLLASRLADTFNLPSIVACFMPGDVVVASVRSSRGFKVKGLLDYCSKVFTDYGGHDAAAGFNLPLEKWVDFLQLCSEYMESIEFDEDEESVEIDAELPHAYVNIDLLKILDRFEPYGEGNPPLVFMSKAVPIIEADIVGKTEKKHLKLMLDFGANKWPALWWNAGDKYRTEFSKGDKLDVVFKIQKNYWNGTESPQLLILDAKKN